MLTLFSKPKTINLQDKDLTRLLEKIRDKLELSKGVWSEYLGISLVQYERILTHKETLTALSLYHLSEQLCLNPSVFETGRIDFEALIEAERGNALYLNPKYKVAAYSRKHTAINALNYVSKYRGEYLRKAINRHFQINEAFWHSELDAPVNIQFMTDLWAYLKTHRFSDAEFRAIGFHSSSTLKDSSIGRKLSSQRSVTDVFECMFSDFMENFERNSSYKIARLNSSQCVVESRYKSDVTEALGVDRIGSEEGCQVRAGIFSALPTYLGHIAATTHETHCIHRDDPYCRFIIDFSTASLTKNGVQRLTLLT